LPLPVPGGASIANIIQFSGTGKQIENHQVFSKIFQIFIMPKESPRDVLSGDTFSFSSRLRVSEL